MTYRTLHMALPTWPPLRSLLSRLKRRASDKASPDSLPDSLLRDIGVNRLELRFADRHRLHIR
jgi:hypothetical protein